MRIEAPELRIVPESLWQAVHDRLGRRRAVYLSRMGGKVHGRPLAGTISPYLLPGFVACGCCSSEGLCEQAPEARQFAPLGGFPFTMREVQSLDDLNPGQLQLNLVTERLHLGTRSEYYVWRQELKERLRVKRKAAVQHGARINVSLRCAPSDVRKCDLGEVETEALDVKVREAARRIAPGFH
jgi:hypothetical protein